MIEVLEEFFRKDDLYQAIELFVKYLLNGLGGGDIFFSGGGDLFAI
jgi:hypothetical protein